MTLKKSLFLILILIGGGIFSCAPKKDDMIAINVLLTPADEMNQHALLLSKAIKKHNPSSMVLDENHIPHITLLQGFVRESDLPEIKKALEGLYGQIRDKELHASKMVYNTQTDSAFAMIRIDLSTPLASIHKETIRRMEPFIEQDGTADAFVPNPDGSPIDKFTLDYVPRFIEDYSFENFDPHISLGAARKEFLDSLSQHVFRPAAFKASSLSLYQLGDSGTAQKPLWHSE